jgi:hypothetical protein
VFLPGKKILQILAGQDRSQNLPSNGNIRQDLSVRLFLFQSPYSLFRLPGYGGGAVLLRIINWAVG